MNPQARHAQLHKVLAETVALPEDWHHFGVMTTPVLEALARNLEDRPIQNSVETGTGKSTLLISHVSQHHRVFSIDDTGVGESLSRVRNSPLLRSDVVEFVIGPTQQTLPLYRFKEPLQFVLIDGPHGYPFPELEYWCLYPHLQPGALFVLDDIHIPNIGAMFRFLREDTMFELIEVVRATAFFRRTASPTFDPFGDGWQDQRYNQRRFPRHYLWSEKLKARIPKRFKQILKARGFS